MNKASTIVRVLGFEYNSLLVLLCLPGHDIYLIVYDLEATSFCIARSRLHIIALSFGCRC